MITTYGYEPLTGRLASINATVGSQTLYSISYSYNDNSQRDWAQVVRKTTGGADETEEWEFDYDDQDQLSFAHQYVNGEESGPQYDYGFDAVGNHTESGWEINALNQVKHLPGVSGEIAYDARGNVTYDGHFTYTWDAQDHLIAAQNSVAKFEFGYDSQGRRIWKKSYGWVNNGWQLGQHLIFAYDGWNLLAEFLVVGNQQQLYRSYAWGPDLGGGIGGLLSITDHLASGGPKTYYPFYDGNGNVMGLGDSNGTVVATYKYDPFGKLVESTGSAAEINPFRFSSKYYDADTGLYYFGYRYYSPEMQRWMGRDPIQEEGGMNLYAFVGNDPVNRVDPFGLAQEGVVDIKISGRNALVVDAQTGRKQWQWDTRALPRDNQVEDVYDWTGVVGSRADYSIDRRKFEKMVIDKIPEGYWYGGTATIRWVDISREEAAIINSTSPELLSVSGSYSIYWYARRRYLDEAVMNWVKTLTAFKDEIHTQINENKAFTQNMFLGEATAAIAAGVASVLKILSQAVGEGSSLTRQMTWMRNRTPWQRTVYQRSDINWRLVRPVGAKLAGMTNQEAAAVGYAPVRINAAGKVEEVTLHHLNQDPRGGVAEIWRSTHNNVPHQMDPPGNWREARPDWAKAWRDEQPSYWRWRVGEYNPKPTDRLLLPGD